MRAVGGRRALLCWTSASDGGLVGRCFLRRGCLSGESTSCMWASSRSSGCCSWSCGAMRGGDGLARLWSSSLRCRKLAKKVRRLSAPL